MSPSFTNEDESDRVVGRADTGPRSSGSSCRPISCLISYQNRMYQSSRSKSGLLKVVNRSILYPGCPGWDEPPRVRRRSSWWERLLSGRDGLTRLQPGACCGCGAGSCTSLTCNGTSFSLVLGTSLTLTAHFSDSTTQSITLAPSTGASWSSGLTWPGSFITSGADGVAGDTSCIPGAFSLRLITSVDFSTECTFTCSTATSISLSPFLIVWDGTFDGSANYYFDQCPSSIYMLGTDPSVKTIQISQ